MEHHRALASDLTTTTTTSDSNNNGIVHYRHHYNRRKKRTTRQQQLPSSTATTRPQSIPMSLVDTTLNQQQTVMKRPLSWTKKWTKLFSSCSSERPTPIESSPPTITSIEKHARAQSENDVFKRANIDQNETKFIPTTQSSFTVHPSSSIDSNQDGTFSRTSSHYYHQHQSIEKVDNSNSVTYRERSRRYSNPFLSSARYEGGEEARVPNRNSTAAHSSQRSAHSKPAQSLSRSADRLHSKASRRELRYEEHNDYIPPSPPPPLTTTLNSIRCHPTIDHYARTLNQSSYFYSTHRQSQIEAYPSSTSNSRSLLPRPYSSNIPISCHTTQSHLIPITYSSTTPRIRSMSQQAADNENTYGKLSECHSPLIPLENSAVKAPRRIETAYSQFPTASSTHPEPVYANTQSLYDNILYPTASKVIQRNDKSILDPNQEKKSCASQTQLTWTMATFSSFVDLENQSIIIPQTDPATLHSIVPHYQSQVPPSASPNTVEHIKRISPNLQFMDESNSSSGHHPHPHTPNSSKVIMIEKRDGSFQTLLTIAPTHELDSGRAIFLPDSTPSPLSTGSSSTTDQRHHHHHHRPRRHKSRSNTSRHTISTRDVGLQVNIQTVKKITFSSEKSDESSLATTVTSPSQPTVIPSRELKHVQTNTESLSTKKDRSTSYESDIHLVTSSSQTLDTSMNVSRQTKAAQTLTKSLRDQSIETNNRGLFVCDLSSLLKSNLDEISPSPSSSFTAALIERKP